MEATANIRPRRCVHLTPPRAVRVPDLLEPAGGVRTAVLEPGSGIPSASGNRTVRYRGTRVRYVGHLLGYDGPPLELTSFGSREDGVPGFVDPPLPFSYEVGVMAEG